MDDELLNLTIRFGLQVGMGCVELHINENSFMLTSDETFKVIRGSDIQIKPIPSYGNKFDDWEEDVDWATEELRGKERIRLGKISRNTELTILFEEDRLEEELEFGMLTIEVVGTGSVLVLTSAMGALVDDFEQLRVEIGSSVELTAITMDGVSFSHWEAKEENKSFRIDASMEKEMTFVAVFQADESETNELPSVDDLFAEDPEKVVDSEESEDEEVEIEEPAEEEEIEETPRYGELSVKSTEGGTYMLKTDELSFMSESTEYEKYSIRVGSLVELLAIPGEGYAFNRITDETQWISSGHGRMVDGEYYATVEFEEIEQVEIAEDETEVERPKEEEVAAPINDTSQYLSFGGMVVPIAMRKSRLFEPTSATIEVSLDFDGTFVMNGEKFHDLVLIRGVRYEFTANHDKALIEMLDENLELLDDSHGIEENRISIEEPLVFTPNELTPEELIYRTVYARDFIGKVHVRDERYYGRVISYGYVEGCTVESTEDSVTTGDLGEYLIDIDGSEFITPSTTASGTDIHTDTTNAMSYRTVTGAMQINALTTLFAEIYDLEETTYDLPQMNDMMRKSFGITFECDILNDDPIRETLLGNLDYVDLYKQLVIVNSLLRFIGFVSPNQLGEFYDGLVSKITHGRVFQLTSEEYVSGLISGFVNSSAKIIIASTLKNLFGVINNINESTTKDTLEKIYAVGRTFEQDYLPALKDSNDESPLNAATTAWDQFNTNLSNAQSGVTELELPSEVVVRVNAECDRTSLVSLSRVMKKTLDNQFFNNVTDKTLHINTLKFLYGEIISVSYNTDEVCYHISMLPLEFASGLNSIDATSISFGYESIDDCCSNLSENVFEDDEPATAESDIFSFKLIESGDEVVMYETTVTTKSHPVEYLGNDEYRLYLDELVGEGNLNEASPGYCVVPTDYAIPMEQRYLKVGYNSGHEVQPVIQVDIGNQQILIIITQMVTPGTLICVTNVDHGLSEGDDITISNSSDGKIDGSHSVTSITSPTIFSVTVTMGDGDQNVDYANLGGQFENFAGTKVYCNVDDLAEGDTVIFDKTTNGLTFNIDEISSDASGDYFVVSEILPSDVESVVKSHVNENQEEVVEFMFTSKLQYYSVANVEYSTDRLWLTYDPDIAPTGREGNKISYIQFFYNNL